MTSRVNLLDGKVWLDDEVVEAGIAVQDDKIIRIAKEPNLPKSDSNLRLSDRLVLPGLIDVHVHLRDSQLSYKEDFLTGTAAAVAGGFAAVLDMPNTIPPVTTAKRLAERIGEAAGRLYCDVGFYATPLSVEDVIPLSRAGSVAYKVYMHKSLGGERYSSQSELVKLARRIRRTGKVLAVHAEDPQMLGELREPVTPESHADAHPSKAELSAVRQALAACAAAGCRLHIAHVSTAASVSLVQKAKASGDDVTCEATPHHCSLTRDTFSGLGGLAVVEPPLRDESERRSILEGLASGIIDIVASDHAPHTIDEKLCENPRPGFPGLEIALPVLLTWVKKGKLSLRSVVRALSSKPAERFSLKGYGRLAEGQRANLTVVDLKSSRRVDARLFHSRAKYSPFDGQQVTGSVWATFVGGENVFLDGELTVSRGVGRVIA